MDIRRGAAGLLLWFLPIGSSLLGGCEAVPDCRQDRTAVAFTAQGYFAVVSEKYQVPDGMYLPFDSIRDIEYHLYPEEGALHVSDEDGEVNLPLGFYPLAITGTGVDDRSCFLAGVDDHGLSRVEQVAIDADTLTVAHRAVLYAGRDLGVPTALEYVSVTGGEYLFVLDALDSELWVLQLPSRLLRLVRIDGPLSGMRSMQAAYSENQPSISLLFSQRLGDMHYLPPDEVVTVMTDEDGDLKFEGIERPKWSEYTSRRD